MTSCEYDSTRERFYLKIKEGDWVYSMTLDELNVLYESINAALMDMNTIKERDTKRE